MTSPDAFAVDPRRVEDDRRERTWRLAAIELPRLRVGGSILLALAVLLHNYAMPTVAAPDAWIDAAIALGVNALVAWAAVAFFLRRRIPRDLTLLFLSLDLPVWTYAIYCSGAERSLLFFVLLLRVADQVQTTFRRAVGFALLGAGCYAVMLGLLVATADRAVAIESGLPKLVLLLFAGIYISLAARTAETRRQRLTEAVRMSRDLIRRLEEAQQRTEEASAAKSEFVARMSHEMRTPLQGVIGMLQLAIDDEPGPATLRRLETARRSADALLTMIDDVLDFARIEARRVDLEPVYFSIRELAADTMRGVGTLAAAKELTLSYLVDSDCPDTLWGDPLRLRQILTNLLGNAIKFTPEGEVSLRVRRSGRMTTFEVMDTGIGIDPASRENMFEPFTQLDSSLSRRFGGAGLGLSIAQRLAGAMGGTIGVTSEVGKGSSFALSLDLDADAVGTTPAVPSWESELTGHSVLVVEPADLARQAIAAMLRSRGIFATAVAQREEAPAGRFALAVTADPVLEIQPRIVIVSPLQHRPWEPFQLARPVIERELLDAVGAILGLAGRSAAMPSAAAPRTLRSRHVLLVEDNEVNREVVSEMLVRLGCEVTAAEDGERALQLLAAQPFDLVFMDVQLPGIDGLEVARRYRSRGGRSAIIALTAHTTREDRDRCLAAGMQSVMIKPVGPAMLAAAMEEVFAPAEPDVITSANPALLERLRVAFARQTPELIDAMQEAIAGEDAETLSRLAHKLKGSLSYFQSAATEVARQVEAAARAGDLAAARALMPALQTEIDAIAARLEKSHA